jgi:hypothetical protein
MMVFGGVSQGGLRNLSDAAAYNPVTKTWRSLADLPYGLEREAEAVLGDGVVYAWPSWFGHAEATPAPLAYDLDTDSWQPLLTPEGLDTPALRQRPRHRRRFRASNGDLAATPSRPARTDEERGWQRGQPGRHMDRLRNGGVDRLDRNRMGCAYDLDRRLRSQHTDMATLGPCPRPLNWPVAPPAHLDGHPTPRVRRAGPHLHAVTHGSHRPTGGQLRPWGGQPSDGIAWVPSSLRVL